MTTRHARPEHRRPDRFSDRAPAAPGAYALLIELTRPATLNVGALGALAFDPGFYLYAGSANGPGGVRARVARHCRRGKKAHWHVDRLIAAGRIVDVLAVPGGDECRIVERVRSALNAIAPAPGFGSSDCRRCPAHLLAMPVGVDRDDLAAVITG